MILVSMVSLLLLSPVPLSTSRGGAGTAAALSEMQTLDNALQQVFIDTNFITTLENLDDTSSPHDFPNEHQYIDDEGGARVLRPSKGIFEPSRVMLTQRPIGLEWQGPYISVQAQNMDGDDSNYDPYTPLDPWGTPYFLYTPVGRVSPINGTVSLDDYADDFSDYKIVSFGPDGLMGGGDDLFRTLGFELTEPIVSSVRIEFAGTRADDLELRIKGEFFGATQGTGEVLLDGNPVTSITSWSGNLIVATLNTLPAQGSVFTVETDGGATLTYTGYLSSLTLAGAGGVWEFYE